MTCEHCQSIEQALNAQAQILQNNQQFEAAAQLRFSGLWPMQQSCPERSDLIGTSHASTLLDPSDNLSEKHLEAIKAATQLLSQITV